jgi:Ca2+-binding EF-hand superfamily protein
LDGFERNAMEAGEFKELVRRTFNLKLTAAEVGAVFKMFDENDGIEYMAPATQVIDY